MHISSQRFVLAAVSWAVLSVAGAAVAAPAVLYDDFEDGTVDPAKFSVFTHENVDNASGTILGDGQDLNDARVNETLIPGYLTTWGGADFDGNDRAGAVTPQFTGFFHGATGGADPVFEAQIFANAEHSRNSNYQIGWRTSGNLSAPPADGRFPGLNLLIDPAAGNEFTVRIEGPAGQNYGNPAFTTTGGAGANGLDLRIVDRFTEGAEVGGVNTHLIEFFFNGSTTRSGFFFDQGPYFDPWNGLTGEAVGLSGAGGYQFGRYDRLDLTPIPEPSALALMALGGIGLVTRRRRRPA